MILFGRLCGVAAVLLLLTACQSTRSVSFEAAKLESIRRIANPTLRGQLTKPEGNGPFPAVLLLHGCNGQNDLDLIDWPVRLGRWGYVTLSIDSFGTRGVWTNCGWTTISGIQLVADAYGALEFLAAQPFVDAGKIAAIGFSMGGTTVLDFAQDQWGYFVDTKGKLKLKAVVAMYPRCGRADRVDAMLTAPVQIIIGELDDWTPVRECQILSKHISSKGAPLSLTVLPGAYHSFDYFTYNGRSVGRRLVRGHVLEPNTRATARSVSLTKDFFARYLGK